ncbi:DUF6157 family protein [Fluviicola sp.]|jgi:hypothetical protein|uniref:DUF6157 family protein n=1 Tax=Fluviicola sp. TaxID=1917219 RepID=UPI0028360240|nr:DUF6157 family protein [Fluviicola sp.]MDR0803313.1 DUF6157 family protein [Fluviicola sp.]
MQDKIHTTNYRDTFIEVAEDTKAVAGTVPPSKKDQKSVAEIQYELLSKNPYKYTSDEILFQVFATRNDLAEAEQEKARKQFFSKGQACFRASPLTKTYGFGVHHDSNGKMALYGMETVEYQQFLNNASVKKVKAMRTSRK